MSKAVKVRVESRHLFAHGKNGQLVRHQIGDEISMTQAEMDALPKGAVKLLKEAKASDERAKKVAKAEAKAAEPTAQSRQGLLRKIAEKVGKTNLTPEDVNPALPDGEEPFTKAEIKRFGFGE